MEIAAPAGDGSVVVRVRLDGDADRGPSLVRLVALYMVVFGLALMVFAYFALTRLIVRPIEQLVDSADRVANGARTLRVPRYGARELVELGSSVQSMAERLISEEAALIMKVEELTDATRRLTDTRAQLVRSERMASVGRLAAGLAHEIGNPIAALIGMEDLLLEGGLDAGAERDFLRRMRAETDRIHVVIRDLLDFARPEGRVDADAGPPAPAEVGAVVADVVSLVRPQKGLRAVRIDAELQPGIMVALPAPRLTQVLLNLVLNASAAAAAGPREPGRVVIRARADGPIASGSRSRTTDPGSTPAIRDRLFEPFATTKRVARAPASAWPCAGASSSRSGARWRRDAPARRAVYVGCPRASGARGARIGSTGCARRARGQRLALRADDVAVVGLVGVGHAGLCARRARAGRDALAPARGLVLRARVVEPEEAAEHRRDERQRRRRAARPPEPGRPRRESSGSRRPPWPTAQGEHRAGAHQRAEERLEPALDLRVRRPRWAFRR